MDDSIEYVKNLHHRIKSLQERKVELNKSAAAATSNQQTACERGRVELRHGVSSPSQVKMEKAALAVSQNPRLSEEELKGIHDVLRSCVEKMEVHADLPHQVVIEMVCKPQPRLQSNILLCMENLNLDVMQCSINKIAHRLICVITAKVLHYSCDTSVSNSYSAYFPTNYRNFFGTSVSTVKEYNITKDGSDRLGDWMYEVLIQISIKLRLGNEYCMPMFCEECLNRNEVVDKEETNNTTCGQVFDQTVCSLFYVYSRKKRT